jgi:hypothetical protein
MVQASENPYIQMSKEAGMKKLIDRLLTLRQKCAELRSQERETKEEIRKLEAEIIAKQNELGLTSVSTGEYTAFQSTQTYVHIEDYDRFKEYIRTHDLFELLQKRPSKAVATELVEEGLVDSLEDIGLTSHSEIKINVRRK